MNGIPLSAALVTIAITVHLNMMLVTLIIIENSRSDLTLDAKIWISMMWMVFFYNLIFDKEE